MPVYNYTTLDEPNQVGLTTQVTGINDAGQIVGFYSDASNDAGFLLSGGTYTNFDDPLGANGTFATGINDVGQIVGSYLDAGGHQHGFFHSGGIYITLDDGTNGTAPLGINDAG